MPNRGYQKLLPAPKHLKKGLLKRIEREIVERLASRRATLCPSEIARDLWPDAWRHRMEDVRSAARRIAAQGGIVWLQRGRRVDPSRARGPVRLARGPRFSELSGS